MMNIAKTGISSDGRPYVVITGFRLENSDGAISAVSTLKTPITLCEGDSMDINLKVENIRLIK